jgi:hypothetical protein
VMDYLWFWFSKFLVDLSITITVITVLAIIILRNGRLSDG